MAKTSRLEQAEWSPEHAARADPRADVAAPTAIPSTPVITPAMIARSGSVADSRWSPSGTRLAWVGSYDGRADLVVAPADGSGPPTVISADTGIGGGYAWSSDDELVVAGADGRLAVVTVDGRLVRVLTRDGRAFAPAVSARGEIAFGLERDDACDVAVVPIDGSAWPVRQSDADYAWDPSWSPDGRRLAWHEWDLPDMPWDGSRIVVRDASSRGGAAATARKVVAGGDAVAVGQPRFAPDGKRISFVSDVEGWPVVWTADPDGGDARPVLQEQHEHAEPAWAPGQRSYVWSPDAAQIAWCRNEDGFGRLMIATPGARSARELSKGWHRGLAWTAQGIVCTRSGAVTPGQVVVLAPNGSGRRAIARGPVGGFEQTPLVEPRAVTYRSGNATVHALLYRPAGKAQPPLLLHLHGGPTGQATADWTPRVQWLVQRGFAVLQPNFRGSTGYGRAYAQALSGKWGDVDVIDAAAGIRHAAKEGWCDPARVVVMGGSAGGFTALLVAAKHPDLVHGVVALYPVTDLLDLAVTTHRFESGYHLRLVGPLPQRAARYRERSPIALASTIRAPVLLFHGSADRSVRPEQSAALARALSHPERVERVEYEGEGHGWKRAATVADELARIDAFFTRHALI
jgi:dipeptidyl aminopeptidase/acylaminoacyl peptidase